MPIPLILVLALLLLFLLILLLRIRLTVTYRESVCVELGILFLRFRLYPRRKKLKLRQYSKKRLAKAEKKRESKALKKQRKKEKRQAQHAKSKPKRTLTQNIRLVRVLASALIRRTHKHLRLHAARLHVCVATGDAASTAVLYGAVSGAVSDLLAGLDQVTRLKAVTPDVCVEPDFLRERSAADIKLVFSLRVYGAIATALSVGLAYLRTKPTPKKNKQIPQDKKGT